jgi:hypothetical protein
MRHRLWGYRVTNLGHNETVVCDAQDRPLVLIRRKLLPSSCNICFLHDLQGVTPDDPAYQGKNEMRYLLLPNTL